MSIRALQTPLRLGQFAILAVVALVVALAVPLKAFADPVEVARFDTAEYSLVLTRDLSPSVESMEVTITNLSTESTTFALGADLETAGIVEQLWLKPFWDEVTQAVVAPGETITRGFPFWPGTTVTFFRSVESSPEEIGSYTMPGTHVRTIFDFFEDESGNQTGGVFEIGPHVEVTSTPVVRGGGIAITATNLPPGPTTAYLNLNSNFDSLPDGDFVENPSDPLFLLGTGIVAADGTLTLKGVVPADVDLDTNYTVLFENANGFGVHGIARSECTADSCVESADVAVSAGTAIPVVAGTATITGPAKVNGTLVANATGWGPSGVELLYQWAANGVPIVGATGSTYKVTSAEVGRSLTVAVTGWGPGFAPSSVASTLTAVVPPASTFTAKPAPTISGTAAVGQKVTASVTAWTLNASFTYQWLADGVPVGTNAKTFTITPAEVGKIITFRLTGTRVGTETATVDSNSLGPVALGQITAPATRPSISGQYKVGGTLTVTIGTWKPAPGFAIQWSIGGVDVPGATGTTLLVPPTVGVTSSVGAIPSVRVTASVPGYQNLTKSATGAQTIAAGTFAPKGTLTVLGTVAVGQTLTADPGIWAPAPNFAYQWSIGGIVQPAATTSTFVVPIAAKGKKISVSVTASLPGYTTVVKSVTTVKVP